MYACGGSYIASSVYRANLVVELALLLFGIATLPYVYVILKRIRNTP